MNLKRALFGALTIALMACSQTNGETTETQPATDTATTVASATTETTATETAATATQPPAAEEKPMTTDSKVAELHTTAGEIDIRFFPEVAPNHVKNFIESTSRAGVVFDVTTERVYQGALLTLRRACLATWSFH
jgi:hypothetical protein